MKVKSNKDQVIKSIHKIKTKIDIINLLLVKVKNELEELKQILEKD